MKAASSTLLLLAMVTTGACAEQAAPDHVAVKFTWADECQYRERTEVGVLWEGSDGVAGYVRFPCENQAGTALLVSDTYDIKVDYEYCDYGNTLFPDCEGEYGMELGQVDIVGPDQVEIDLDPVLSGL